MAQFTHVKFQLNFGVDSMLKSVENLHSMHVNGISETPLTCNGKFIGEFNATCYLSLQIPQGNAMDYPH